MDKAHFWLTFGSTIAFGLMAGILFAFSSFVMPALARIPAPQGIAAMQSINVSIETPSFLLLFVGSTLGSIAVGVIAILRRGTPGAGLALAGAAVYFLGTIVWTAAFHLPKNAALGKPAADSAEAAALWERFVPVWTAGNTFRTIAATVASALLVLALVEMRGDVGSVAR